MLPQTNHVSSNTETTKKRPFKDEAEDIDATTTNLKKMRPIKTVATIPISLEKYHILKYNEKINGLFSNTTVVRYQNNKMCDVLVNINSKK